VKKGKILGIFSIVILVVVIVLGILFAFRKPQLPTPQEQNGIIFEDDTVLFLGKEGNVAVVSSFCESQSAILNLSNNCKSYNALIMQGNGKNVEEVILSLVRSYPVENLLVPTKVSDEFVKQIRQLRPEISILKLSSGRYFTLGDMLMKVEKNLDTSCTLSLYHGKNSFLISSEPFLVEEDKYTYAIMADAALEASDITCDYAVYAGTADRLTLLSRANTLTPFGLGMIYFFDDGSSFDVLYAE